MSHDYKQKLIFDEPEESSSEDQERFNRQQHFDEQLRFIVEDTDESNDIEEELAHVLDPTQSRQGYGWLKFLFVAFLAMLIWQTVEYVVVAYHQRDWLSLGWSAIISLIALFGLSALGKEWLTLKRLKRRQTEREQAELLLSSNSIGEAKPFCIQLASQNVLVKHHDGYERWMHSLSETHSDQEVLELYDAMVMSQQDQLARRLVAKYSREAAIMVSVSSLAVADVLLVAWRNLRLIDQIARVYGVELGYWSRIKLLKLVLFNMAVTGATEVITDAGVDFLSMDLAGRVSTRIAQGVGVGLLTGRLGLKAITLMRPLPWLPGKQPKLSEIRRDLLLQFTRKEKQSNRMKTKSSQPSSL